MLPDMKTSSADSKSSKFSTVSVHRHAVAGKVGHVPRPGDSGQERAVGDRCEDLAVFDHEDIGRRAFRPRCPSHRRPAHCRNLWRAPRSAFGRCWGTGIPPLRLPRRLPAQVGETRGRQAHGGFGGCHGRLFKADGKRGRTIAEQSPSHRRRCPNTSGANRSRRPSRSCECRPR